MEKICWEEVEKNIKKRHESDEEILRGFQAEKEYLKGIKKDYGEPNK